MEQCITSQSPHCQSYQKLNIGNKRLVFDQIIWIICLDEMLVEDSSPTAIAARQITQLRELSFIILTWV